MAKFRFNLLCMLVAFSLAAHAMAQGRSGNIANTAADFPQVLLFRSDTVLVGCRPSQQRDVAEFFDGFIPKLLDEERTSLPTTVPSILIKFDIRNPEKLFLLHYNGYEVATHGREMYYPQNVDDFCPGHWAFEPGTTLKQDLTAEQTTFEVEDTLQMSEVGYAWRNDGEVVVYPTDMVIVEVDQKGDRLWETAEYITFAEKAGNQLTVQRGCYGSAARPYKSGRAVVLPIKGNVWADNVVWTYNFSTECPRDSRG